MLHDQQSNIQNKPQSGQTRTGKPERANPNGQTQAGKPLLNWKRKVLFMAETIYTIPINEVFEENIAEKQFSCPFCTLAAKLEADELDIILGASMMEPDIRIQTNKQGFCSHHFSKMLRFSKRLPLALILESHLGEINEKCNKKGIFKPSPDKLQKQLEELSDSCYVCSRIEYNQKRLLANAIYMWQTDEEFRKKFASQPYFCFSHAARLLAIAKNEMNKRNVADFSEALEKVVFGQSEELQQEVSRFVKSFDYRYSEEPLSESTKTSVERAIRLLAGDDSASIGKT